RFVQATDRGFKFIRTHYMRLLSGGIRRPWIIMVIFALLMGLTGYFFTKVPSEYTPVEDRGSFMIMVNGPEGASFAYIKEYMDEIERRLLPLTQGGEFNTMLVRAPRGFGNLASFNTGMVMVVLKDWGTRRTGWEI